MRAKELGLRVVAVDANADAPGLAIADVAVLLDFRDVAAVTDVGRANEVDGVLTVASDRAVPVVAAVAERLGLPGIGTRTAHLMTHKVAMRRELATAGVPQPRYAAVRVRREIFAAAETVGFPAVLKPADSGGQRGIFLLGSVDDLDRHLRAALAESPSREVVVESYHEGHELNGLVVARDGRMTPLTLSDRLRPPGQGFGVGVLHVYPSKLFGDTLAEAERIAVHAVRTLGLRNGIAYPQLLVSKSGEVRVVEVAARVPGGQMADLVWHAVGVDLVEIALRQALGEEVADEMIRPRFSKPLAIRFLTSSPGPLPTGKVKTVSGLDRVLASPGVVQADVFLATGKTIRPVRIDADRAGYVIAVGDTNMQAIERAEAAARKLSVEVE